MAEIDTALRRYYRANVKFPAKLVEASLVGDLPITVEVRACQVGAAIGPQPVGVHREVLIGPDELFFADDRHRRLIGRRSRPLLTRLF